MRVRKARDSISNCLAYLAIHEYLKAPRSTYKIVLVLLNKLVASRTSTELRGEMNWEMTRFSFEATFEIEISCVVCICNHNE